MPSNRPVLALLLLLLAPCVAARQKTIQRDTLASYVRRAQQQALDLTPSSPGSLWTDNGRLTNLFADYKAVRIGDLITVVVVDDVTASSADSVSTARTLNATAGIAALPGKLSTGGVQNLFSPSSTQALSGKSQAATTSSLRSSFSGRVVAVLPNGNMVIEAERQLTMNNERQTILLRGLVRPGDVAPNNTVLSNSIGNLELELKGKGVLSDGTRPPNLWTRWLLKILGF